MKEERPAGRRAADNDNKDNAMMTPEAGSTIPPGERQRRALLLDQAWRAVKIPPAATGGASADRRSVRPANSGTRPGLRRGGSGPSEAGDEPADGDRPRYWTAEELAAWLADPNTLPTLARFFARVQIVPGGCWVWKGALQSAGYGRLQVGGRRLYAHRVAYTWLLGPIREGLQLDHVRARGCTNRNCVNPLHLEPVTQRENLLRGDTIVAAHAAKTHCIHGHAFDEANTYRGGRGRECRACGRERARARYHRRRREAAAGTGEQA